MLNKTSDFCEKLFIAGSGGQGVLQLGRILAQSAVREDMFTTYYPSYGAEVRGGVVNCTVVISGREIVSPVISAADTMLVMNSQSMNKFAGKLESGSMLIVNSSLVTLTSHFEKKIKLFSIKATEIAERLGNAKTANTVMLGAYIRIKKMIAEDTVISVLEGIFAGKDDILKANIEALKEGIANV